MTTPVEQVTLAARLRSLLEKGERQASRRGESTLVSTSVPIPHVDSVALFDRAVPEERALWEQPSEALSMVAVGAAERLSGRGDDRFAQVAAGWRSLMSSAVLDDLYSAPIPGPVCLGGFAFDPAREPDSRWRGYPDALLTVPRFLFACRGESCWLTVNVMVTPGSDVQGAADAVAGALQQLLAGDDGATGGAELAGGVSVEDDDQADRWKETVTAVVGDIRRGEIEKLVLARAVRARCLGRFDPGPVLRRLRSGYGDCTVFAFARGESCFAGATPDRLVRLDGRTVQATALAGSTARGATDDEDGSLAEALRADRKERHEHALVVEALRAALEPTCSQLWVPEAPTLLRMPNVQHLCTTLEGVMKDGGTILDLIGRLHPTPATGGLPRQAALSLIRAYEPLDRGWYSGPFGWIDRQGSGDFVVAIRSALLRGNDALLYAGCGIVADSDPEREYRESCLKLRPMLWALNTE
ncbi:MAG: isochorismate synthase [Dehalococcoidia bacterium]